MKTIEEIQHPKISACQRAKRLAILYICGGPVSEIKNLRELEQVENLSALIYQELELQDRDTRHAIAEALSFAAKDLEEIQDHRGPFLREYDAHKIAMNTKAL